LKTYLGGSTGARLCSVALSLATSSWRRLTGRGSGQRSNSLTWGGSRAHACPIAPSSRRCQAHAAARVSRNCKTLALVGARYWRASALIHGLRCVTGSTRIHGHLEFIGSKTRAQALVLIGLAPPLQTSSCRWKGEW
jgi:hypothetical protein